MKAKIISKGQLLLADENKYVFFKKGNLYFSKSMQDSPEFLCCIPQSGFKKLLSKISLAERMLRLAPRTAVWVDDHSFLIAHRGIVYRIELESGKITQDHAFVPGMNAPLSFASVCGVKGFRDGIVYGTYVGESEYPVSVWHRSMDGIWKEMFQFPKGSVRHVHQILADPEHDRLLILTGDTGPEVAIWEVKDNFATVTPLLQGSQQYRSCFAFVEDDHIYYATDTPLEQNYLYDYDTANQTVKVLKELPGPVIYGTVLNQAGCRSYLFATSVEPDSRIRGKRYLLTYKKGPGVKDSHTCLYFGNPQKGFRVIAKFKKDFLPMVLFQFGNVLFPAGKSEKIRICPQSVYKYHGKTVEIEEEL